MGFLDRFKTQSAAKEVAEAPRRSTIAPSAVAFGKWVDPEVNVAGEEWERRLNDFARKSAGVLLDAEVPLFRSTSPRKGEGTFRYAFWLIACDVEFAYRSWSGYQWPPSAQNGEYVGNHLATSLLLTKTGILCVASTEGRFTASGGVDDREMDMLFTKIGRQVDLLRSHDWGWNNHGRWKRDPNKEGAHVYGQGPYSRTSRFEEKYSRDWKTQPPEPGKGTSQALSSFVKTKGSIRWPRGFTNFDF